MRKLVLSIKEVYASPVSILLDLMIASIVQREQ